MGAGPVAEPEAAARDRDRAVALIRRGLTPQRVQEAVTPGQMRRVCKRHQVVPEQVDWLVARWPVVKPRGERGPYRAEKYEGTPCRVCGTTERYVSSGGCVACARRKAKEAKKAHVEASR